MLGLKLNYVSKKKIYIIDSGNDDQCWRIVDFRLSFNQTIFQWNASDYPTAPGGDFNWICTIACAL